ncbi:hypothetical protein HDV01_003344 [Terramyces sp. JEL0728]|nr:hypothetical protein HDV01_003344 [Terramyces sp. JEL0728]
MRQVFKRLLTSISSEITPEIQPIQVVEEKLPSRIRKNYLSEIQIVGQSAILHKSTEIVNQPKMDFSQLDKYDNLKNAWFEYPFKQAFLKTFTTNNRIGLVELQKNVFGLDVRVDLMARCLKYEKSWKEQGTESTKARGQVRGTGKKAAPQKGRGAARIGSLRAPQFRGGYNVHGPRPHNKTTDIQKKVYSAGIRHALSAKFQQSQLLVVDHLSLSTGTKQELKDVLEAHGLSGQKVYFIYGSLDSDIPLTNAVDMFAKKPKTDLLPHGERPLLITHANQVSVSTLLEYDYIVMDKEASEVLEEMYA